MKPVLSILICLLSFFVAGAQWTGPDVNKRIFYTAGFVGVGTDVPNYKFHLRTTDSSPVFFSETPESQLSFFRGSIELKGKPNYQTPLLAWYTPAGSRQAYLGGRTDSFGLTLENGSSLFINGGNVGIGVVDTKGYQLAVAGKIVSEEVVVKLRQYWPDYVFSHTYRLPSLREVQKFILEHGHLPDVPDGETIKKSGIALAEMNALLLKKIEELTLYAIEQSNQIDSVSKRIIELELQSRK